MKKLMLFTAAMLVAAPLQAMDASYDPEATADSVIKVKDSNGDGMISMSEYEHVGVLQFQRIDTDGDGVISGEEMFVHRYKGRREMDIKTPKVRNQIIANAVKRWDENGDLQITMDEKLKPLRNEFAVIDRDLDKQISRDELIAHWERRKAQMERARSEGSGKDKNR